MNLDGERPLTLEPRNDRRPPRRLGGKALLAGVAGACVLGLGLGLAAQPQLITDIVAPAMQPRAQTDRPQMDIVMGEPEPDAPLPPRPPLETMDAPPVFDPPGVAEAPEPPIPFEPPPAPIAAIPPHAPMASIARPAPEPPMATRRQRFDCRDAGSLAEELVCADAVLSAVDRQMSRAYDRALRSGAPREALQAEQQDWLASREDAALRSPRALARLYDQRIDELNAIADEGR